MNNARLLIALWGCAVLCLVGVISAGTEMVDNFRSHNYVITYLPDDQVKIQITARHGSDEYTTAIRNALGEIQMRQGRKVDFIFTDEITVVLKPPKPNVSSNEGT